MRDSFYVNCGELNLINYPELDEDSSPRVLEYRMLLQEVLIRRKSWLDKYYGVVEENDCYYLVSKTKSFQKAWFLGQKLFFAKEGLIKLLLDDSAFDVLKELVQVK